MVCSQFGLKPHKDKVTFIKQNGVCFGCLEKAGHISKNCTKRLTCSICNKQHPSALHIKVKEQASHASQQTSEQTLVSTIKVSRDAGEHAGAGDAQSFAKCTMSIVPVQVKCSKGSKIINTYAFLDPGSSATFCTEKLMTKLNITGQKTNILLRTINQETSTSTYLVNGLEVSALNENNSIALPEVYTQKSMPVDVKNIPRKEKLSKWPYLSEVQIPILKAEVELLIGNNAPKAIEPWQVINSHGDGPYAVKTLLGWVINGPLETNAITDSRGYHDVTINRISVAKLEDLIVQQYNHDFNEIVDDKEMSVEDKRFVTIAEQSIKLQDGHYSIDLPFRNNSPVMPNNYQVAEQRLIGLKKKFNRSEQFRTEYTEFLEDVISKGYAEVVPQAEVQRSDGKVWYIPHHGVFHPKKGTIRVVFDCGATFHGTSLNAELLQGPDLTSTLMGVLTRFRQHPVALMADIKSMFHQVRVSRSDADFLRFLWWPKGDVSLPPVEHRMTVHLFGAVSSPSCANFALRQTAKDNRSSISPEVMSTIETNFYVDDCLKCVETEEQAIDLMEDLTSVCHKGGFHLTKWVSNSRSVLAHIPKDDRATEMKELDFDRDKLPTERALGLLWCVESDMFKFNISVTDKAHTRRNILSMVSSIYDPLGFLSPLTLLAKLLLQDLCRHKYSWDYEIPQAAAERWRRWVAGLEELTDFSVPRCVKPTGIGASAQAELHHFSDASEHAYDDLEVKKSTAVYSAIIKTYDNPTCQLLEYFSDWNKLKRAVVWYLKLKNLLAMKVKRKKQIQCDVLPQPQTRSQSRRLDGELKDFKNALGGRCISLDDLMRAEKAIVVFCQHQRYPEEMARLKDAAAGKGLSQKSTICKLDPVLKDGVLRVGGRLNRAAMPEEAKRPIILPKDLHISTLILRHIHEQLGHGGRNHVLSQLRKRYWITNANSATRKVISECIVCRHVRGKRGEQKMADLPKGRLEADLPPFSNVGVDYFGPFETKRGRSLVKRYGVIFTCMSSRAVHLEMAHTLDTDSCIDALRRFTSRRGQVTHIRSDNGTNLVGAKKELQNAISN
ncbi:hypothetical protein N1851_034101 [Merluccius polli]|uniref:Integrase zinc-binding domain-containing protein n=1 Tax=Merluccius polli TaxID=89951 RepID=A0AA47NM19_MERPO|nr:hypothetical protein N1851_034101 [Merluccius polli]